MTMCCDAGDAALGAAGEIENVSQAFQPGNSSVVARRPARLTRLKGCFLPLAPRAYSMRIVPDVPTVLHFFWVTMHSHFAVAANKK